MGTKNNSAFSRFYLQKEDTVNNSSDNKNDKEKEHKKSVQVMTSSLPQNVQGHTGFLTFATLLSKK